MSEITKQGTTASGVEYTMIRYGDRTPMDLFHEWVAALRSGKYEQATGSLRFKDSYCCLGVLCEIGGLKSEKVGSIGTYSYYINEYGHESCSDHVLPNMFADQLGLSQNGCFRAGVVRLKGVDITPEHREMGCLGEVNDSGYFSFEDIADVIEFFFQPATETSKDNE